jgi:hypothetical protein
MYLKYINIDKRKLKLLKLMNLLILTYILVELKKFKIKSYLQNKHKLYHKNHLKWVMRILKKFWSIIVESINHRMHQKIMRYNTKKMLNITIIG